MDVILAFATAVIVLVIASAGVALTFPRTPQLRLADQRRKKKAQ